MRRIVNTAQLSAVMVVKTATFVSSVDFVIILGYNLPMVTATDRVDGSLRRDLAILDALSSEEARSSTGLGVSRLAELVGRDKGQISRTMRALESEGLVERDTVTREYRLGWRIFSMAAVSIQSHLMLTAPSVLRVLATELKEAVHLCVLQGGEVLTVVSQVPPGSNRLGWEGRCVPAACTSAGRVLLMDLGLEDLRARFGPTDFAPAGPSRKVSSVDEFFAEIVRVRSQGYALVDEEFEPDLVGASAPIRDFRGGVLAALNFSATKPHLRYSLREAGDAVAAAAGEISARLGGGQDRRVGALATAGWHKPS
ncbi:IclR family transcriptional regulator [Ferrimicrobium sp.]|uniref:IclR family transcriptional regulator n=2 Tax=Ferrimicrobium sp. TaxID=2926050 RepID=UPI00260CAEEE|nr:IclR family transcriptional regulator [Ferrimicrobium sp.]